MSYNYTQYLAELANLAGTSTTNPFFLIEVPAAIDYAEQRLYRDIDLISTIVTDTSQTCVPSSRIISIPAAFVVLNNINVITPAGAQPNNGKRNPLTRKSQAVLDLFWPSSTGAGRPEIFAQQNQGTLLFGPWPDQGYVVELIGTQRPEPLSSANPVTFLTQNLPDIFLTASMIHISAYQKNFGSQADDPRTAQSWENQYKLELTSADAEELRKRYMGTTYAPPPGQMAPPTAQG